MAELVHDSPEAWVARHIQDYIESDGKKGQHKFGVTNLLLTTRGRKSGKLRRTALIYGEDNGRYVIIGSNGGNANHPLWYLNLRADPQVELQVGPDVFIADASPATGAEKERLWRMMADRFPQYDSYRKGTTRDIPVVVLQRQSAAMPA